MPTFPTGLDSFTTHANGDVIDPAYDNAQQTAISALETKVGIDSSADTTSLDYKVKNVASIDPGHKHTNASVTLAKADVGLGSVDNTSDATKNAAAVTLTNKTIVGANNTISNITEAMQTLADNTTNNVVSNSKHGYAPKGDGDTTKFWRADWTEQTVSLLPNSLATTAITVATANVTETTTSTTYVKLKQFTVSYPGTYKVSGTITIFNTGDTGNLEIYKNGVDASVGTSLTGTASQSFSLTTGTLAAGDTIEIWGKTTTGGAGHSTSVSAVTIGAVFAPTVTVNID